MVAAGGVIGVTHTEQGEPIAEATDDEEDEDEDGSSEEDPPEEPETEDS